MGTKNLTAVAMAAALVVISGCASDQDERFDPRGLGNAQRSVSGTYVPEPLRTLPTQLESPFLPENRNKPNYPKEAPASQPLAPDNKVVRLPLREITQRAVATNLSVKVSGYTPAIDETRVTEADARFDPEFFTNLTYRTNRQPEIQFTGDNSEQWQGEIGIRQLLPSGGQIEASLKPVRYHFTNGAGEQTVTSQEVGLQLTQPLLRDFGSTVNQARIVINRNNQRISVLDFRKDLEEMLRNVEEVYWRLVQAQQNVGIQERLLQRSIDTSDITSKRYNQDVTLEQISNAVSRVESARSDLIRARQNVHDLSDRLKNLMNDPDFPVAGDILILPADAPMEQPIIFDFQDAVSTGLLNRFELGQQQLRVDSASVAMEVAKNNRLPQLNLVGSIGLISAEDGEGQTFFEGTNNNFGEDANAVSWSLGLQFAHKIGNREALAIFRRSQLQRQQAIDQYRQQIDQVTLDIKLAQREMETSYQAIAQTRAARFAASKALEVVQTLETNGEPLVRQFVETKLNRQQELAQAERAEADAIASYNIAISRLESAKGTLLRYNNVIMEEKPRP
ncbi:MAG: TolC family protein [Burkholderiales bacterium]|nr:TolC family protein [Phycisphaerae bacterium]